MKTQTRASTLLASLIVIGLVVGWMFSRPRIQPGEPRSVEATSQAVPAPQVAHSEPLAVRTPDAGHGHTPSPAGTAHAVGRRLVAQARAQAVAPSNPLKLEKLAKFPVAPLLELRKLKRGETFTIEALGQKLSGKMELNVPTNEEGSWGVVAALEGMEGATLSLEKGVRGLRGSLNNASGSVAYKLKDAGDGHTLEVAHVKITDLVCGTAKGVGLPGTHAIQLPTEAELKAMHEAEVASAGPSLAAASAPVAPTAGTLSLQSRPGSARVLYLDFDGELVDGTGWNTSSQVGFGGPINALPSNLNTDLDVRYIWRAISEDYSPFDVNVTTSRAVYDATPVSMRMMLILTATEYWIPSTDGTAGIASTDTFGSVLYPCCWAFTSASPGNRRWFATTGAHELGHTFGLHHHTSATEGYYSGHNGNATYTSWRPIMGTSYRDLVTWDPGGFAGAENLQDDIALIASYLSTLSDPKAGVTTLPHTSGSVALDGRFGFANGSNPVRPKASEDYSFRTAGGLVDIQAMPRPLVTDADLTDSELRVQSNLDLRLQVYNSSNTLVFADDGPGKRDARIQQILPAGDYTLKILTTEAPEPTYYSTYGQMGLYSIVGNIPQSPNIAVAPTNLTVTTPLGQVAAAQEVTVTGHSLGAAGSFTAVGNASWLVVTAANGGAFTNGNGTLSLTFQSASLPLGTHTAYVTVSSPQAINTVIVPVTLSVSVPANPNLITISTNEAVASPYPSTINVPAGSGPITRIQAKINGFSHTYPADVQMLLTSPTGKKVMLFDQSGGSTDATNANFTFASGGNTLISPLVSGTYVPSGSAISSSLPGPAPAGPYASTMSAFIGDSPAGAWNLYVNDLHSGDGGSISSWALNIETATGTTQITTPITSGSTWNYKDDGADQGTAWRQPGVVETWNSGPAKLGYSSGGGEATVLSSGKITYYFRKRINLTSIHEIKALTFAVSFDDGAVVYLNGTEVGRTSTMRTGPVTSTTTSGDSNGYRTESFDAPTALLVEGENLVAVEVHNLSASSSDIAFDCQATLIRLINPLNSAPTFVSNPFMRSQALSGRPYTSTLLGAAGDGDVGDSLVYSKINGPAWLTVAADGTLTGAPTDADAGVNAWVVRATDAAGLSTDATLNITVSPSLPVVTVAPSGSVLESGAVGQFVFTRNKTSGILTVPFTVAGTATSGTDYVALPASVTFVDGAATASLSLIPIQDGLVDQGETVTLSLGPDTSYSIGTPVSATHTIQDDDGPQAVITYGATWNYKDDGADQGTAWRQPAVTETWPSAAALLGYGNVNPTTTISSGRITYYFRKRITIANLSEIASARINLKFDDGAVIYLNGTEAARTSTMGSGTVTHTTTASTVNSLATESFNSVPINLLVEGENLIAVEVHNNSSSSSDIAFDLEMIVSRIATGGNTAPIFTANPFSKPTALAGVTYTGQTLAGSATDANAGDTLAYSKVGGPAWLTIAAGGALSGTPSNADVGTNTFTIRVTDSAGLTADATLNLTVQGGFSAWLASYFPGGGANAQATADPDRDGAVNLLEYATGMNPTVIDTAPISATKVGSTVEIFYSRNSTATDVTSTVEWSDTLLNDWSTAGVSAPMVLDDNGMTQQIKVTVPAGNGVPRRFVRLKVTKP